jgi:hypothetical protein
MRVQTTLPGGRRRLIRTARACAAALALLGAASAPAAAETVTGTVFHDYNTNGLRDGDPAAGAVDSGVGGLVVRALTGTRTVVATATTADDGTYSLDAPNRRVRLDLTVPSPWWPTRQLNGLRSDEQFVDASSPVRGADFGVHRIREWSVDAPPVTYPVQWAGAVDGPNAGSDGIREISYFTTPSTNSTFQREPSRRALASFGEVGSVYGLGTDQRDGTLYAGAFYKRFAGLTRHGPGAIFRIGPSGAVSLWADLPAGSDGHPTSSDIRAWFGSAPANRDMSWNLVGNTGLGSVRVDPADRNLYVVNLADRSLYRLPLDGTPPVRAAAVTPIPDPGCANGDWRPFSVGFDRATQTMYAGGVCSAETSQSTADLRAVVYRVGDPDGSPSFTPVLSIPLTYDRVNRNTVNHDNTSDWRPWPTAATINDRGFLSPADTGRGTRPSTSGPVLLNDESYPELTGISFDSDGSLQLAFRDLMGDMSGFALAGEGNGPHQSVTIQGDLLRAAPAGDGTFVLESGGVVGGRRGFGFTTVAAGGYGPIGPGGGYFYDPHPGHGASAGPTNYEGGALQVPGFRDVLSTQTDAIDVRDNGLLWHRNTDGRMMRRFQNMVTTGTSPSAGFSKANGLGDVDAYMGRAPVQIGNRLWYDVDHDGLQDAAERPVVDTVVELLDDQGVVIDNTTTDSRGEYVFAIAPDTAYTVRVPLAQASLDGWQVTQAFAGDDRRIDSNGRELDGRSVASVRPHGVGQNDHSYDFGFDRFRPRPPTPRPPEPPPPTPEEPQPPTPLGPPPPPEPQYAGAEPSPQAPLVLVKLLVRRVPGRGAPRRLAFALVLRNAGPFTVDGVRLCDQLPHLLDLLRTTSGARRLGDRQVCWRMATLASGAQRTFRIRTSLRRHPPAGVVVNRARAVARGARPARARVVVRVAPRRSPHVTG